MKLADRELVYDDDLKVYIGRRQFRSTDGTLKFSTTWYAEFYVDGKQHRQALGVRKRLSAIKEGVKLAESLVSGQRRLTDRKRIKVADLVTSYMEWQRLNDRAPKTLEKYDYVLVRLFQPWWEKRGDQPATKFKAGDYLAFKEKLTADGMQAKTVADRMMIVRQLFKWAATKCDPPLIPKYPLANVALPKVPDKQQPCFTAEQVRLILENADEHERPIYATFAFTGMRFGEVRDLRWSDISLRDGGGNIFVRRGGSRQEMTKSGKNRAIPISWELHDVLAKLSRDEGRVFSHPPTRKYSAGVRPLEQTQMLKRFKGLCQRLGFDNLKSLKLHTFRHYFASVCARNNVSYKYALRWMGHSSSNILDLYFHMHDREAQAAINSLDFGTRAPRNV
jgi:integrase